MTLENAGRLSVSVSVSCFSTDPDPNALPRTVNVCGGAAGGRQVATGQVARPAELADLAGTGPTDSTSTWRLPQAPIALAACRSYGRFC